MSNKSKQSKRNDKSKRKKKNKPRSRTTSNSVITPRTKNKPAKFICELYQNAQNLDIFLSTHCKITNLTQRIQSYFKPSNPDASKLYDLAMEFFNKSLICLTTSPDQIPSISPATNMNTIVEDFLHCKFAKIGYDRKDSVLTNSYCFTNRQYAGSRKYIPLLNIDNVTISNANDSINYLLTSKQCKILHELIGDDMLYFLLNTTTIFVPVMFKVNQYWQLIGVPASERLWGQRIKKKLNKMQEKEGKKEGKKYKIYKSKYKKQSHSKGYLMLTDFNKRKCQCRQYVNDGKKAKEAKVNKSVIQCFLCNKLATSDHVSGQKHMKKANVFIRRIKMETDYPIRCIMCKGKNVRLKTRRAWDSHVIFMHQKDLLMFYGKSTEITETIKYKHVRKHIQRTPKAMPTPLKPRQSLLGKRKAQSLDLWNQHKKYRRLNHDSTSVADRRNIDAMKKGLKKRTNSTYIRFHGKTARSALKVFEAKKNIKRQNLRSLEIKRYAIFYGGKNAGQYPLLSRANLLNILPASNIGAELLIRHIFFGQTLQFFKDKQKELMAEQASLSRNIQRKRNKKGTPKAKSYSLSQNSYHSPPPSRQRLMRASTAPIGSAYNLYSPTPTAPKSQSIYSFSSKSQTPRPAPKTLRPRQHKIDFIAYVPTLRIIRLFGGTLRARYKRFIPFFKHLLVNYKSKVNWYQFRECIEGSEQEKKDKLFWLDDEEESDMDLYTPTPTPTQITTSSSASIFSSNSMQSTCSMSQTSLPSQTMAMFERKPAVALKTKLKTLIAYYRPYATVMQFIKTFLNRIFRHDKRWGFGTDGNQCKFKNFLWKMIIAQRHEKFSMLQAVGGIKPCVLNTFINKEHVNNFSTHIQETKWDITIRFIYWLINDVIVDLLRFNYYVTERSYTYGPVVTYYSVKIWKNIIDLYLKQNRNMFEPISKRTLWKKKKNTDLGIGFLRFVPKPSSLRPIINLSRNSVISDPSNISIQKTLRAPNKRLNQLFSILTHEVNQYKINNRKSDILGCSVFCVREYYHNWLLFVRKYKAVHGDPSDPNSRNLPKVYCVSADLSKCYDRVNQDILMEIVERKLLYKDKYELLKYSAIFPECGSIFQRYKYGVNYNEIEDIAQDTTKHRGPFIISTQGYKTSLRNDEIMELLSHNISTSIVYLAGKYYQHNVGISQGSIISQLLCCVYIGQCEKQIQAQILKESRNDTICRLMMRHVDDFIFFTTDKAEAVLFADILHAGIDEFNMLANEDKTSTNFVYRGKGNDGGSHWISWCGFLWNTFTLNVRANHRDHTLNIKANLLTSCSGKFVSSKLSKLIRHKIEPLLLDENINTASNIVYNLYQSFYVSGARFVRFVIALPCRNEYFLWNVLIELSKYTWNRIQIQKSVASLKTIEIQFPFKWSELQYIASRAYKHSIMTKYHGLFSRTFQRKLDKYIANKSKCISLHYKDMFDKYTDANQLMHDKLHDFIY